MPISRGAEKISYISYKTCKIQFLYKILNKKHRDSNSCKCLPVLMLKKSVSTYLYFIFQIVRRVSLILRLVSQFIGSARYFFHRTAGLLGSRCCFFYATSRLFKNSRNIFNMMIHFLTTGNNFIQVSNNLFYTSYMLLTAVLIPINVCYVVVI